MKNYMLIILIPTLLMLLALLVSTVALIIINDHLKSENKELSRKLDLNYKIEKDLKSEIESLNNKYLQILDNNKILSETQLSKKAKLYVEFINWSFEGIRLEIYGPKLFAQEVNTNSPGILKRKSERINDPILIEMLKEAQWIPYTEMMEFEDWFFIIDYILGQLDKEMKSNIQEKDPDALNELPTDAGNM